MNLNSMYVEYMYIYISSSVTGYLGDFLLRSNGGKFVARPLVLLTGSRSFFSISTVVIFIRAYIDIYIARASLRSPITKESSAEYLIVRWYLGSTRQRRERTR